MRSNANFIKLTLLLKIMLKPKKELLLTISIRFEAERGWEGRKMTTRGYDLV